MDEAGKAAAAASGCSRRGSGEMSCRRPGERVGEGLGKVAGRIVVYTRVGTWAELGAHRAYRCDSGTGGAHEARPVGFVNLPIFL